MSISDPLAISAAAPTPALNFAIVDTSQPYSSRRMDPLNDYKLTIQHYPKPNGSTRHYVNVEQHKDVVLDGKTTRQRCSVSVAISVPASGFDAADMTAMYELIDDAIRAATLAKILNHES